MRYVQSAVQSAIILGMLTAVPVAAEDMTVTTRPTPKTMTAGSHVYFDDRKCPTGQIAMFSKARNKEEIRKKCVHKNGG